MGAHTGFWTASPCALCRYGPTEATVHSSTMLVPKDDSEICIGTPEANVHCYVVDSNMSPVPLGVPGELLLSGPRLAAGYVNQKELTAASFVPNPCNAAIEAQIPPAMRQYYAVAYRTGKCCAQACIGALALPLLNCQGNTQEPFDCGLQLCAEAFGLLPFVMSKKKKLVRTLMSHR